MFEFQVCSSTEKQLQKLFSILNIQKYSIEWGWNNVWVGHENDRPLCFGFASVDSDKNNLIDTCHQLGIEIVYLEQLTINPHHHSLYED